jgi:membrane-bound lytic murein transglycosylase MltF
LAVLLAVALQPGIAFAQRGSNADRYDDLFRKYSKRYFGVGFDWQYFKAQGMAESGLDPDATSYVGARGIMQLMPGTYALIKSRKPEMGVIEDPESNIAAGILHSRGLWLTWNEPGTTEDRLRFMFGSYNAGEGTIRRAQRVARAEKLDHRTWSSIESVAPKVQRWRYRETLPYVRKIENNHAKLLQQSRRGRFAKAKDPSQDVSQKAAHDSARSKGARR